MGRRRYQKPAVRQSRAGSKQNARWEFRARIDVIGADGQPKRIEKTYALGECSEMGKRAAEKIRDQILAEVINKPATVLQSQIPFGRVLDEFSEMMTPQVRQRTADQYASVIQCHIRPAFGHLRMCDMTNQVCQRWLNELRPKLKRSSRKHVLALFRNIWERATDWNYTRELCPLRRASLGPIEAGREKTLPTVEQFRGMLQLLKEPYRSMLLVATFTGMRVSEIRGIQRGDVKDGILTIRRSLNQRNEICEVKNAASWRPVPVGHLEGIWTARSTEKTLKPYGSAATWDAMTDISTPTKTIQSTKKRELSAGAVSVTDSADSPSVRHVITTTQTQNTDFLFDRGYRCCQDALRKAAKAVGIEYAGFGWHTFRRASVTWGKRAGISQADSMAQHGHSETKTNDLYYVDNDYDLERQARQDAALFDAVMFGVQKGKDVQ